MSALLEVDSVCLNFAGLKALDTVSMHLESGSLHALIGPNGAGKTSMFNCISGVYHPSAGTIRFGGRDLAGLAAHDIAALGVARLFQNLALFENLTTLENLLVGAHHSFASRWWQDVLWLPKSRREEVRLRRRAEDVIEFLHLEAYRDRPVGILPYGVRKRIELGRALCMDARLLLLDEPAAGLNQEETAELARYILDIHEEMGITQLLIEHELGLVMDLAQTITVLDFGQVIAEGAPADIQQDPAVREAYLGGKAGGDDDAGA